MLPIPNTLVGQERVHISFHADIETRYYVMNQEYQLRETSLVKIDLSLMEFSRNPSNYLRIIIHDQRVLIP